MGVVLVRVALMRVVDVARLIPVVFVVVALVDIVLLHWLYLPRDVLDVRQALASSRDPLPQRSSLSPS